MSLALLSACEKKDDAASAEAAAGSASAAASAATASPATSGQPNFGGITKVSQEVEAVGSTQELAVLAALQMAVAQVNGVRVASQMQSVRAGLNLTVDGKSAGSVSSEVFVQKLVGASQGAVTGFEILSQQEVDKVDEEAISRVRASDGGYSYSASSSSDASVGVSGSSNSSAQYTGQGDSGNAQSSRSFSGSATSSEKASVDVKRAPTSYESDSTYRKMRSYWKVRVKVHVAKYQAPDEQGRPKIVVAMPRTQAVSYPVGDGSVTSAEVAQAIRGRLSDMLTQTKRFIVLDREFGQEMQAEIDKINSGTVRVEDSARLGQQLSTDLILIPTIERFEYPKHVQKLRMSDRELVSYSGGGSITLRLLNATTGEVVMSDSFEHRLASADPSTMPRVVDGKNMAANMMESFSSQMGKAIVGEIFPVTVVALTGDQAVLSQGGETLSAGQRWQAVALGEELKDPQTGRSLGRHEVPLGVVRIDRVSTQTSYGTFEGGAPNLNGQPFKAGSIELKGLAGGKDKAALTAARPDLSATEAAPGKTRISNERVASPKVLSGKPAVDTPTADKPADNSLKPAMSRKQDDNW
jgi:curli biogenesis system outer membrane secretion channel CsgG